MSNCHAHCRSCDRCFTGTTAFDQHRQGPWEDRRCEAPDGLERPLTAHEGTCDNCPGPTQVTQVWGK